MKGIKVVGGIPLNGEVRIQGSKNAALPLMAAALLNKGTTILYGCPKIADVFVMEEILRLLGAKTVWKNHTLEIDAEFVTKTQVDEEQGRKMRSSIILLGGLLGRFQEGAVPHPGGCTIGKRPIDLHLDVLRQMGAEISEKQGQILAKTTGLKGCGIQFPFVSVGATQNAVLAAVLAEGTTVLEGCSKEPEVCALCRFLSKAGAKIKGIGTSKLTITGVEELHDTEFQVPKDRIAAGTYLCASAITRGTCILLDAPIEEMGAALWAYKKMGGQYTCNSGKLTLCSFYADRPLEHLQTQVYPGFPTDLQSVFMAVLTVAKGESRITENIFEDRFKTVSQLQAMGARIELEGNTARILPGYLKGTNVAASELRGGAALLVAGLAAQGETYVKNCSYIERGYEDICRDLSMLGAQIFRD